MIKGSCNLAGSNPSPIFAIFSSSTLTLIAHGHLMFNLEMLIAVRQINSFNLSFSFMNFLQR